MKKVIALLFVAFMLAGCGGTRVVVKTHQRPKIHSHASSAAVEANFSGKPYRTFQMDAQTTCNDYMQDTRKGKPYGTWIIRVCYHAPSS